MPDFEDIAPTAGGRPGMLLADFRGAAIMVSSEAHRLLSLATASNDGRLPPEVEQLCRRLATAYAKVAATTASHRHQTPRGSFDFEAQVLVGNAGDTPKIALTVNHRDTLRARILRRVKVLRLTPRQSQVCILIASGNSTQTIARSLGISRHTANEHVRWIYNKLDVHNRAQLVAQLLAG